MRRRSVGTSNRGNMRHGLISLLTVVVIICLATAAVLTVATSHAMAALSERQANMTSEGYDAERAAQSMLSKLEDELATARTAGTTDVASLMSRIDSQANKMLAEVCPQGVTATYSVEDTHLTCTFITSNGRMLQTDVVIGDGGTYDVVSWKLTAAPQEEDNGDTLWAGPTAGE